MMLNDVSLVILILTLNAFCLGIVTLIRLRNGL